MDIAPLPPPASSRALLLPELRFLCDRVFDLEAQCTAQRVEFSRLYGRIRALEAELHQGRNWLYFLADKLSALEDKAQQLSVKIRALVSIFKETFGETVSRLQVWF